MLSATSRGRQGVGPRGDIRERPDLRLDLSRVISGPVPDREEGGVCHDGGAKLGIRKSPRPDEFGQRTVRGVQPGIFPGRVGPAEDQELYRPVAFPRGQRNRINPAGDGPGTGHQNERRPACRGECQARSADSRIGGHPERQHYAGDDREREASSEPSIHHRARELPGKSESTCRAIEPSERISTTRAAMMLATAIKRLDCRSAPPAPPPERRGHTQTATVYTAPSTTAAVRRMPPVSPSGLGSREPRAAPERVPGLSVTNVRRRPATQAGPDPYEVATASCTSAALWSGNSGSSEIQEPDKEPN
jgi:hypothetical protein